MGILLRKAEERDWARLYAWRTDPVTASASLQPAPDLQTHMKWFREALRDGDLIYVAEDRSLSRTVGSGRAKTRSKGVVELMVVVEPRYRGLGYAPAIVTELLASVRVVLGKPVRFVAVVKPDNAASLRAFAACGFRPVRFKDDAVELALVG
jgi:RimJ/RimL family protein N-acetyltransferase